MSCAPVVSNCFGDLNVLGEDVVRKILLEYGLSSYIVRDVCTQFREIVKSTGSAYHHLHLLGESIKNGHLLAARHIVEKYAHLLYTTYENKLSIVKLAIDTGDADFLRATICQPVSPISKFVRAEPAKEMSGSAYEVKFLPPYLNAPDGDEK